MHAALLEREGDELADADQLHRVDHACREDRAGLELAGGLLAGLFVTFGPERFTATEVADGPQSLIREQVTNGVAVRMAVLWSLIGSGGQVA